MFRKFAFTLLAVTAMLRSADTKQPVTVDALMHAAPPSSEEVIWSPDGKQFVSQDEGKLTVYSVRSGKTREVLALSKLQDVAEKADRSPITDWTNRRVSETNIQWFPNTKRLLVAEAGDLFAVDVNKGSFDQLTHTPQVERDPKLSPDGRSVSFRKGPDLFVLDVESKEVRQLTSDGSETLLNGQLDWVYPEELDLGTAHWWSPDSQSIAYLQFDISHEPIFPQVSLLKPRGVLEPERYPKAGDPNAEVRLGVVAAKGGETRWMNLGEPRDNLLARVAWVPDSKQVAAVKLNRVQNKLDLYLADVRTGNARVVLHEESPTWINLAKGDREPIFLTSSNQFLWTSERDGFRHIYLYTTDGQVQKRLTSGAWEVTEISGVDAEAKRIYYVSTEVSPLERQLYSIGLDGTGKQRLTKTSGTHQISLAPDGSSYLDTFSSLKQVPRSVLYGNDGQEMRQFRAPDDSEVKTYNLMPTELVTVKADNGTELYARLTKPSGFDPSKKYPAIVMVYGGPGVQTVSDAWAGVSMSQVMADRGFVVWGLDNRGSFHRGHKFEEAIYHHMGQHELEDQQTGIKHLVGMGFVDPQRIGLFGWSYGGYMTLYTVTNAPGLIRAAVAGAPVTSWRNYDSIYTERYMGMPDENAEAYKTTSPQTKAGDLQAKLLIIHNIEDDNVHFANTMQMADALEQSGKLFYMLTYPQRSHGVSGPVRKHMYEQILSFFEQNLK